MFDTGVDPGAPGLRLTSTGQPKILDVIDATGSGDVDTSTIVSPTNQQLTGLSGRPLCVPSTWRNPSARYHLGLKRGYELFPAPLINRLKSKRRESWDESQRRLESELRRQIALSDGHSSPSETGHRKDLETRLEQLNALQESYDDPGPIFDCVVFHDGDVWRAVLDTDEDGDLADEEALSDYRVERRHATFGDETLLNFAINIYEEGRLLSVVVDSGMHGTHVAGIVAACFPDNPEHSGIAPGAQIISVKIGDTRLDSMETASAFVRGLGAVRRHRCDIINLSYGEPTTLPNRGRLIRMLSEIVNEDGVIFVASAGNDGPALSTVGAPGGTTSALVGVGAYVSPAMMAAACSMRPGLPETQYTFSGRGPTFDGDPGVNISAPGGAISPVPNWTLQRHQLANGTSMASPNAAGGIALILSGLKAEGIRYTPEMVRRAVENTARSIPGVEVFAQGRGLLQVDLAFEMCRSIGRNRVEAPRLEVTLPRERTSRGVYLREPADSARPRDVTVRISPQYPKSADPTQLPAGVHYAEVTGVDLDDIITGPAFRLPITVVKPITLTGSTQVTWSEQLRLAPAQLERRFLAVPDGATRAQLKVRAGDLDAPCRLVVHGLQILPLQPYTATQTLRHLTMDVQDEQVIDFPVTAGRTLELCLGQFWSSPGAGDFEFTFTFRGVVPNPETVFLDADAGVKAVDVTATLGEAVLMPRARLQGWRRSVTPSKVELRPLSPDRDQLPEGRLVHELILNYSFDQATPGHVTPRFPALNGRLYDGEFESQLWMVFDDAKQLLVVDDGWNPDAVRLERGRHHLRFQLRHDQPARLSRLKDLPLLLDQELDSPIEVGCFANPDDALAKEPKLTSQSLAHRERSRLFLAAPSPSDLTRQAKPGDLLFGTVHYEDTDGRDYPLVCPVPATVDTQPASEPAKAEPDLETRLAKARREFEISQLDQLGGDDNSAAFERLAAELESRYPEDLSVPVKRLHRLDDAGRPQRLRSVVAAADEILGRIDSSELAAALGRRAGDNPDEAQDRQNLERQRDRLVDALYRKGRALAWMEWPEEAPPRDGPTGTEPESPFAAEVIEELFEANYRELSSWVDPTSEEYVLLAIQREWRQGKLGEALRLLEGRIKACRTDATLQRKRIQLLEALGWAEWVDYERRWQLFRFPTSYPPF